MNPLDSYIKDRLDGLSREIGTLLDSDVVSVTGPLLPGVDRTLRKAIENQPQQKSERVCVILDTLGGVVGAVERMVAVIRYNYERMTVIVPDKAMSAGTIFALSANRILMDHFFVLGPIDPPIGKDGELLPALANLNQFKRLNQKSASGTMTSAEFALVNKFDPGELYQYEQSAR